MNKSKDQILLESLYDKVVEEAKKKVNPWAVAKSIAKKKHLGPKKEEEIVKGVKKSAKKYGKKVTSDKVVKEEVDNDSLPLNQMSFEDLIEFLNLTPKEAQETREHYNNLSDEDKNEYLENLRNAAEEKNSKYME